MKNWRLFFVIFAPLLLLLIPISALPEGFSEIHLRVMSIFVFAVSAWVLEPFPVYAASLWIIFLQLMMLSNRPLSLIPALGPGQKLLSWEEILGVFASPILILFLGGFFLASAATKVKLDKNLARVLLKPFGQNPKMVLLGLILITAVFSMFMSNTATTAMMLAIVMPVISGLSQGDPLQKALILAVPFAANIGGLGTPIGTPPNAIALKYLMEIHPISFMGWMQFAVPYMVFILFLLWVILIVMFPSATKSIQIDMTGRFLKSVDAYVVYVVCALTLMLWLTGAWHGLNSYTVALLPVCIFSATKIVGKPELRDMSWDVLWLVAGGVALGDSMEKTGLSSLIVQNLPLGSLSMVMMSVIFAILCFVLSNFMSSTATANLVLPLVAAMGMQWGESGATVLILVSCFSCSLAMALPVSTPPNALAYASNRVSQSDMLKAGLMIGLIGLILSLVVFTLFQKAL